VAESSKEVFNPPVIAVTEFIIMEAVLKLSEIFLADKAKFVALVTPRSKAPFVLTAAS